MDVNALVMVKRYQLPHLLFIFFVLCFFSTARADIGENNFSAEMLAQTVDPYPRGELLSSDEKSAVDYLIALGPIRKSRGIWAPEKEKRLEGQLKRITIQIPDGHSAKEAFEYYRNRIETHGGTPLFLCEGRNCGTSNSWANEIFHIKQLYGLDSDQYYGVYELLDKDEHLNYAVVYTVTRGNKRVFAHTEFLETKNNRLAIIAPDSKIILEALKNKGFYELSGMEIVDGKLAFNDDYVAAVVKALNIDRRLKVRIVGHDYSGNPLIEQQKTSLVYADQLKAVLVGKGLDESRFEIHGIGSLAPKYKGQNFRIELVANKNL